MYRKTALVAVLMSAVALGILAIPAISVPTRMQHQTTHAQRNFVAHLSGRTWTSRVNTSVTYTIQTRAQGQAIFHVNTDMTEIKFMLTAANIMNITMAHIHIDNGAALGPIVVWLYPHMPPAKEIPGRFDGVLSMGNITAADLVGPLAGMTIADLVTKMMDGQAYVVVHTSQHPPGEIRGFIH
jgi:hypothetical protein